LAIVAGVAGYLMFKLSGWTGETKLAVLVALGIALIGYPIGWLAGRYVSNDSDVDEKGFRIVAYLGIVGCILPVVGVAMSGMIWQFYKQSRHHKLLYASLSSLVCLLAAANAAYGAAASATVVS
jgi:hypothetical protein